MPASARIRGLSPSLHRMKSCPYVPDSQSYSEIHSIQLMNIDNTNIQPCHWLAIEQAIEENYARYDGFVITHGTDTMVTTAAGPVLPDSAFAKAHHHHRGPEPIDMETRMPEPAWPTAYALRLLSRATT